MVITKNLDTPKMPGWTFYVGDRVLDLSTPQLVGILNVTPDSFSDGGQYFEDVPAALKRVEYYLQHGVFLIDVGGESTRPGAAPVPVDVELTRLVPVIEAIVRRFPEAILSVDTYHLQTMQECVWRGAAWINDIHALQHDPGALEAIAQLRVPVILMHTQPQPFYEHVVEEVTQFLMERKKAAIAAGIGPRQIVLDPGFGFGKFRIHNWALLRHLNHMAVLQAPIMVGLSRKSMFAHLVEGPPTARAGVSAAAAFYAALQGAHFIRTHDVVELQTCLRIWDDLMVDPEIARGSDKTPVHLLSPIQQPTPDTPPDLSHTLSPG